MSIHEDLRHIAAALAEAAATGRATNEFLAEAARCLHEIAFRAGAIEAVAPVPPALPAGVIDLAGRLRHRRRAAPCGGDAA